MSSSRLHFRRNKPLSVETLESRTMFTVVMSPQEQLFLELVNRARANPEAEVLRNPFVSELNQDVEEDRLISSEPKQPLAPHQALIDAMIGHVNDMLRRDYFAHDSPDGGTPSTRAQDAGYPTGAGENIAWSGNTGGIDQNQEVYDRHEGLFESVGHRVNMMRERWREIGPGIRYGIYSQDSVNYQSIMAGTLFGDRGGDHFITGVAITDHIVSNNFYEMGEGLSEVLVRAINTTTQEEYSVRTTGSGGYSLQVPDGIYELRATGSKIPRPLVVQGILVDGQNVKVDFNTRDVNTRYVQGTFFDDANGNGTRDTNEDALPDVLAFVDLNRNERLDDGEPQAASDATGRYRIENLLPTEYVVRVEVPEAWRQSIDGAYVLDVTFRNTIGADYGLRRENIAPLAESDQAAANADEATTIDVLQNDSDADGTIDRDSIQIVTAPQHGQASIIGQRISYTSDAGYSGQDTFSYTVRDDEGIASEPADVTLTVRNGKPWQNPQQPLDVDNDGFVIPRDVLTLRIEINSVGSHNLADRIRQTNSPYFDVTGDNFLSPVDVLSIVRYLNQQNASGEPPNGPPPSPQIADELFAALAFASDEDE